MPFTFRVKTSEWVGLSILLSLVYGYFYLYLGYRFSLGSQSTVKMVLGLLVLLPIALAILLLSITKQWDRVKRGCVISVYGIVLLANALLFSKMTIHLFDSIGYLYEKKIIEVVHDLTQDGSTYVAGVDLLFDRVQPAMSGNGFLEQYILYLNKPSAHLAQWMLPSLELSSTMTLKSEIEKIKQAPVKVFVHFPYIDRIPGLFQFLTDHYEQWWGGIYIYAPRLEAGRHRVSLKFSGRYQIESKGKVSINHHLRHHGEIIRLTKGKVASYAAHSYRIKLLPEYAGALPSVDNLDLPKRFDHECTLIYVFGYPGYLC